MKRKENPVGNKYGRQNFTLNFTEIMISISQGTLGQLRADIVSMKDQYFVTKTADFYAYQPYKGENVTKMQLTRSGSGVILLIKIKELVKANCAKWGC